MNAFLLGSAVVDVIKQLLEDIAEEREGGDPEGLVAREALLPYVSLRKRRNGRGRDEDRLRIEEGITVVPMSPKQASGTNERDDVGYVYLVAIAGGTWTDEITGNWPIGVYEQAIRQRFMHRRLGVGLTGACELGCVVKPGDLPDWAALKDGIDATFMELTCFVREERRY